MRDGKQSRLFEYGFERTRPVVERAQYPLEALCVSCGKSRWLNWVVDGVHVCDKCVGRD
ncbi:MAG: hypothetical protein ABH834_00475 [Candidatus Altiarchaeota archaeon]